MAKYTGLYGMDLTPEEETAGFLDVSKAAGTPLHGIPEFEKKFYASRDYGALPSMYELYLGERPSTTPEAVQAMTQDPAYTGGGGGDGGVNVVDQLGTVGVNTPEQQRLIDEGIGVQLAPGQPISHPAEGMPRTQAELDEFNARPVSTDYDDPYTILGEEEPRATYAEQLQQLQDEQALTNLERARTGQSNAPTYIGRERTLEDAGGIEELGGVMGADWQGEEYIEPQDEQALTNLEQARTGQTFQTVSEIDANNPNFKYLDQFKEDLRNIPSDIKTAFNESKDAGLADLNKLKSFLMDKGGRQVADNVIKIGNTTIDVAKSLTSGAISLIGSALTGIPGLGLLVGMLPPGGPTFQTQKAIELGLAKEGETQDKYGINTQSMLGNYDEYNVDRVGELETALEKARAKYDTEQEYLDMTTYLRQELKDRKEYVDRSGAGGDIQPDATDIDIAADSFLGDGAAAEAAQDLNLMDIQDEMAGVETGDAAEAERIAAEDRAARETAQRIENERAASAREAARSEAARRARDEAARREAHDQPRAGDGGDFSGAGAGTGASGPPGRNYAKGGRVRYSKGGIVDLLK